ncbi:ISNCY family transposase [Candidatus Uhrbacteria bacterium]|nr:ISNCY family transposase [Candidatus Uhrbacteria bacterium]
MTPTPLSEKELRFLPTISAVVQGELTAPQAAARLNLSVRQVLRLKARLRQGGAEGLAHRSRGREAPNRLSLKERVEIEELLRERYFDFTPTHAAEKLSEVHGIHRNRKTIARVMEDMELRVPRKRRRGEIIHRLWREPKARFGEMLQFDGSYHAWFQERFVKEGGSHEACLLSAIDDATGQVPLARFAAHEGILPVMGFWTEYIEKQGVPRAIYLDRFSTYKMNLKEAEGYGDTLTQFERAMGELHCEVIHAHSPQAKGRVERLFQTFQDRLVKELRLAGISNPLDGNDFLRQVFLPDFDKRFARDPFVEGDLHRPLPKTELLFLPEILSRHDSRVLRSDFTISHETSSYQLKPTKGLAMRPKDDVEVRTYPDGSLRLFVRGKAAVFSSIPQKTRMGQPRI